MDESQLSTHILTYLHENVKVELSCTNFVSSEDLPSGKITVTRGLFEKIEGFTKTLGLLVLGYSGIGWINLLRWYERYSECKSGLDDSIFCDLRTEEMGLMGLEAFLMTIIGLYVLTFSVKKKGTRQKKAKPDSSD